MEIAIGGVGYRFYKIESQHRYANEIADAIHKAYNMICGSSIPKIFSAMDSEKINDYLLYLFRHYEDTFNIDDAKGYLKSELMRVIKNVKTTEEEEIRKRIIETRMKSFDSKDVEDYLINSIVQQIYLANDVYVKKMKNAIEESINS